MADLGIEQMQVVFETFLADLGIVVGKQTGLFTAVGNIDVIDVFHELDGFGPADVLIEIAAEFIGDIVFAVREGTGTAEAVHDGTGRTVDAGFDADAVNRTFTFFQRIAGFQDRDLQRRVETAGFVAGKDASRPCSDDD